MTPTVNNERLKLARAIALESPASVETVYWALWRTGDREDIVRAAIHAAIATRQSISPFLAHLPMPDEPYWPPGANMRVAADGLRAALLGLK